MELTEASIFAPTSPAMVKIGRWWFKNRSLSPLPLFLAILVFKPEFVTTPTTILIALAGVILGEVIRIWAVGFAGSVTRTRGESVPELVHVGPFRWVRNPLYVGNILLYTSAGYLFGFQILSLVIFLYSCVQYTFIVRFEENLLSGIFGASYDEYRRQVPRWFPRVPRIVPTGQVFCLKKALRSERSTFYSLAAMVILFFAKQKFLKA